MFLFLFVLPFGHLRGVVLPPGHARLLFSPPLLPLLGQQGVPHPVELLLLSGRDPQLELLAVRQGLQVEGLYHKEPLDRLAVQANHELSNRVPQQRDDEQQQEAVGGVVLVELDVVHQGVGDEDVSDG